MKLRRYRTPALLLLVLHLQACISWYSTPLTPRELITEKRPSAVRITRTDSTRLVIHEPRIENDTIRGVPQTGGCHVAMADYDTCLAALNAVLPLGDVRMIERQAPGALRTLGALAAGVGFISAIIYSLYYMINFVVVVK